MNRSINFRDLTFDEEMVPSSQRSNLFNKTGFLLSCSHVSTIVWLNHLNPNEMLGEKARCELHKNVKYRFKQILEATLFKIAFVLPLTSHHMNYPS